MAKAAGKGEQARRSTVVCLYVPIADCMVFEAIALLCVWFVAAEACWWCSPEIRTAKACTSGASCTLAEGSGNVCH